MDQQEEFQHRFLNEHIRQIRTIASSRDSPQSVRNCSSWNLGLWGFVPLRVLLGVSASENSHEERCSNRSAQWRPFSHGDGGFVKHAWRRLNRSNYVAHIVVVPETKSLVYGGVSRYSTLFSLPNRKDMRGRWCTSVWKRKKCSTSH